jgi:hypothetical protein
VNESNGLAGAIAPLAKYLENCWLDSGALLGLVREGNLIAWDSDIDLGVWESDAAPITAALPHIRAEGYRVSSRSYKGRVYGYTMEEPGRRHAPVHVHVYSRKGDTAWSPQTVAYAPHQRAAVYDGFRGSVAMRDVLMRIKARALGTRGKAGRSTIDRFVWFPVWGAFVVVRNLFERQHWSNAWPFSSLYATYTWLIPARYFDELKTVDLAGLPMRVPVDAEGYLERRYGDWRVPRQDWCYWTDDGCIHAEPPDVALRRIADVHDAAQ